MMLLYFPAAAYKAILEPHGQIVEKATGEVDKSKVRTDVKKVLSFRMEINYRLSAWDRLDVEPDTFVLANLLLTWMEHLKSPILDQVVRGKQGTPKAYIQSSVNEWVLGCVNSWQPEEARIRDHAT